MPNEFYFEIQYFDFNWKISHTSSQSQWQINDVTATVGRTPTKMGDTMDVITRLLILDRFSIFFIARFYSKCAATHVLKIPPHLICVATLPCETLMSENERPSQTDAVISNNF